MFSFFKKPEAPAENKTVAGVMGFRISDAVQELTGLRETNLSMAKARRDAKQKEIDDHNARVEALIAAHNTRKTVLESELATFESEVKAAEEWLQVIDRLPPVTL